MPHKARPKKKQPKIETGYKLSNATRRKMSKAHTGKKLSEETRQKIREARREREALIQLGYLEPFRHTEETKRQLSRIMKRKKHKPTPKARKKSAEERSNRSKDKKLAKQFQKGKL